MYRTGKGVMQSKKKEYIWYAIAATNGNKYEVNSRDEAAESLSPRQLVEAQEEAAEIYEKIYNK